MCFMVTLGLGTATCVRIGQLLGAGRPAAAQRVGLLAMAVGAGGMSVLALLLLSVPEALSAGFTQDPQVQCVARMPNFLLAPSLFFIWKTLVFIERYIGE